MKHFSSYYQNAYVHQTCQGGDILQRAFTINLHDALMRGSCEVTLQMKYMSPLSCRIPVNTKLRKLLTYCKRLPPLKPHDSDHVSKMRSRQRLLVSMNSAYLFWVDSGGRHKWAFGKLSKFSMVGFKRLSRCMKHLKLVSLWDRYTGRWVNQTKHITQKLTLSFWRWDII